MGRELGLAPMLAAAALAVAAGPACKRDRDARPAPPATGAAVPLPPPLASKDFYRIDAGPQTPCAAGEVCEARIVLTALAGYKINKDYPFKFVAEPSPGLAIEGGGAFARDDAKTGTLTLRFKAGKRGPVRLSGTFKLSVCTDEQCEIEEPKISFELPVS
jgi:hypothetical protein